VIEQPLADFGSTSESKQIILDESVIYRAGDNLQLQTSGGYGSAASLSVEIYGYLREAETA
jgi:hypothetical protein